MGSKFVARVFDCGTAEGWKSQIAVAAKPHAPDMPFGGPVMVSMRFCFARPKSHYRTGKNAAILRDTAPDYHTSKPDADNLAKAVLDCMTQLGAWWGDDQQVAQLNVEKWWASGHRLPGCYITVDAIREVA
jgi:crossover junction endodeoxyribonuclease RusA